MLTKKSRYFLLNNKKRSYIKNLYKDTQNSYKRKKKKSREKSLYKDTICIHKSFINESVDPLDLLGYYDKLTTRRIL